MARKKKRKTFRGAKRPLPNPATRWSPTSVEAHRPGLGLRALQVGLSAFMSLVTGLCASGLVLLPGHLAGLDDDTLRYPMLAVVAVGFGLGTGIIEPRSRIPPVVAALVLMLGLRLSGAGGWWAVGSSCLGAVLLAEYLRPFPVSPRRAPG